MAELLQISDPRPPRLTPQWQAFMELGFRPLYVAGAFWAAVSVLLWIFMPQWLAGQMNGVIWHAHEMLWGFIATIAVAFLLTAGANWTGIVPLQGSALAALTALWLAARVAYLVPGATAFWLGALCDALFYLAAALALGRSVYPSRSKRNYGLPLLLLGLGAAHVLYMMAAAGGDYLLLLQRFNTGLLCMAIIALLIARRVIPFFAMRAVPGLTIPMHTRSGHWQLGVSVLAVLFGLLGMPQAMAAALAAAGVLALVQVVAWKPAAVLHKPILWILYLGYAGLGVGLMVAAAQTLGWIVRMAWPAHVIGIAGFSVLIIGMMTRTALGHLGRPLQTDRNMVASYILVILATVLRLIALVPSSITLYALHASAAAWIAAFVLYLWRFFPLLIRPRADRPVAQPARIMRKSGTKPAKPAGQAR